MSTRIWINDKLEQRWNEWPEVPPVKASIYADTLAMQAYEKALAKAKAESILFEYSGTIPTKYVIKPDSFVEIEGEVEAGYQWKNTNPGGHGWINVSEKECLRFKEAGYDTRQIARLKPLEKTAFTHGSWIRIDPEKDNIFNILTTHMKEKGIENYLLNRIVDDVIAMERKGLKDMILNQLRNQWVEDYGALDHITPDINAYFMVGFMNKVLDELKIK